MLDVTYDPHRIAEVFGRTPTVLDVGCGRQGRVAGVERAREVGDLPQTDIVGLAPRAASALAEQPAG